MQSNQNPDLASPDHLLDQEAKEDFTEFVVASDNIESAPH
jgi:hypothetical protein